IASAALSPDESKLAAGLRDGTVVVWEAASMREFSRVSGHPNAVFGAAFSADGRTLVTSSGIGSSLLKFWDVATGGELLSLRLETWNPGVAFSPAGDTLAAAGNDGTRVWFAWPLE